MQLQASKYCAVCLLQLSSLREVTFSDHVSGSLLLSFALKWKEPPSITAASGPHRVTLLELSDSGELGSPRPEHHRFSVSLTKIKHFSNIKCFSNGFVFKHENDSFCQKCSSLQLLLRERVC